MKTAIAATMIHAFELAGLGKAPFRLAGIRDTSAGADATGMVRTGTHNGIDTYTTPGGTCEFCGHAIIVLCEIESADGKRFHVGSDCVEKTDDRGLRKVVKKEINRRRNEQRKAREAKRIGRARTAFGHSSVRAVFEAEPHPSDYHAKQGATKADWIDFIFSHGGNSARLKVARMIEPVVAELLPEPGTLENGTKIGS